MLRLSSSLVEIAADHDPTVPARFWNPIRVLGVHRELVAKGKELMTVHQMLECMNDSKGNVVIEEEGRHADLSW